MGFASSHGMGTGARDYRELVVWQLCDQVRRAVRPLLERPAFRGDLELRDQLRRASERPCPVIAEGFARYHPRDIGRFVRDAKGSLSEIIEHLDRAIAEGMITATEAETIATLCRRARGAAAAFLQYLEHAKAPGIHRSRK